MRRLTATLGFALASAAMTGACQTGGCPSALLTGVLAREGDELVVEEPDGGTGLMERVRWPLGYRLERRSGRLVAVDAGGTVRAGEGDAVRLGGGEVRPGVWGVCGLAEIASRAP